MNINNENNHDKSNEFPEEIISPMFGHDYKDRVITVKKKEEEIFTETEEEKKTTESQTEINYLEKQIEEELHAKSNSEKVKEYQESIKTDTDVLKQYHKQKEDEKLKATLPSNYLNFRDNLQKTSNLKTASDSTSEIDLDEVDEDGDFITINTDTYAQLNADSTISEIIEDIFDNSEN